jgi:hypothetical protein
VVTGRIVKVGKGILLTTLQTRTARTRVKGPETRKGEENGIELRVVERHREEGKGTALLLLLYTGQGHSFFVVSEFGKLPHTSQGRGEFEERRP